MFDKEPEKTGTGGGVSGSPEWRGESGGSSWTSPLESCSEGDSWNEFERGDGGVD